MGGLASGRPHSALQAAAASFLHLRDLQKEFLHDALTTQCWKSMQSDSMIAAPTPHPQGSKGRFSPLASSRLLRFGISRTGL